MVYPIRKLVSTCTPSCHFLIMSHFPIPCVSIILCFNIRIPPRTFHHNSELTFDLSHSISRTMKPSKTVKLRKQMFVRLNWLVSQISLSKNFPMLISAFFFFRQPVPAWRPGIFIVHQSRWPTRHQQFLIRIASTVVKEVQLQRPSTKC